MAEYDNLMKKLKRRGPYQLKHSMVGYWVDGKCGYQVCGYFDERITALKTAIEEIYMAKQQDRNPSWMY